MTVQPVGHRSRRGTSRAARGRRRRRGRTGPGRRRSPRRRRAAARGSRTRPRRTSIATPESCGEVAGVGEQPVGDVDHRGGAGVGGHRPGVVRRLRAAVGLDQHPRGAEAAAEHGQSPGGPALAAGEREHVAGPRRRSAAPGRLVQAPITVTAMTTWSARVRSPPTTLAPTRAHSSAKPRAKSSAHCTGRSAGRGEADRQRGGAAAHRVDVGEVLRGGAVADVGGRGPVAAEVPALDHQVGRDHDVAGLHPQHRGVVAGSDQHVLALREQRGEGVDQPELAGVGQGRVRVGTAMRPIPPDGLAGADGIPIDSRLTAR